MAELVEGTHRRVTEGTHRRQRRRRPVVLLVVLALVLLVTAAVAAVMYWPRGGGRDLAGEECGPAAAVLKAEDWRVERRVGAIYERTPSVVTRCQLDTADPVGSVRVEAVFHPGARGPAEARDWQHTATQGARDESEEREGTRVAAVPGIGERASVSVVSGTVVDLFAVDGELAVWVTVAAVVQNDQDVELAADLARAYLARIGHI